MDRYKIISLKFTNKRQDCQPQQQFCLTITSVVVIDVPSVCLFKHHIGMPHTEITKMFANYNPILVKIRHK